MAELVERVGVVAIGRNEGERLKRCLASIPRGLKVVYVDSGSNDGSVELALAADAEVRKLDLAIPFTAARARNEGWRALLSRHPDLAYVQFVDGDCEFENGWLAVATAFLDAHPDIAVACGRRRERYPQASYFNALCDEEWNTPVGVADECGGDALIRVTALREVDGYDSRLMAGEEPEMCMRLRALNWRIYRIDAPMTVHDAAMLRLSQWWLRARRSGFGYAQVWHATRQRGAPLYGRELSRVVLWAGIVPVSALLLALLVNGWFVLSAPVAWGLQFARLARRDGARKAGLLVLGKFAEMGGALRYVRSRLVGARGHAITYK